MSTIAMALLGSAATAAEAVADANVLVAEAFADGEAALARWEFHGDPKARMSLGPVDGQSQGRAVYVDFRERASWRFVSRQAFRLRAAEQYTLSARVRRNLGYGAMRLIAETTDAAAPTVVAEAEVIDRGNVFRDIDVVFRVAADADVRIGFDARGYAELWIEGIRLQRNVPPLSSYGTGMLLPARSPTAQARYRTGVFLEAEDIVVTPETVTTDDTDADGRWTICRLDPTRNPWLFSDETVIKSDSLSAEEGGRSPPLQLTATGLLPGPYEVILSDPQRDAAVSLDGQVWRRVRGGADEVHLGLLDLSGSLSVWVEHRFRTEANPGPIYVDYLRLMPVYDPARGLEEPTPPAAVPEPPAVQQTGLRVLQERAVPRRSEWVSSGLPFARGAFRAGDGLRVAGVSELTAQPLVLWPDGSVKWLRLGFRTDAGTTDAELTVEYGRGVPRPPTPPAERVAGPQVLRCGEIEVRIGNGVWDGLTLAGRPVLAQAPTVRLRTASGPCLERLHVESISTTGKGGRPEVQVNGHLATADGTVAPLAFEAVLTERADRTLGLRFSVLNESGERYEPEKGCSPALPLTELALVLNGIRLSPAAVQWPTVVVPFDGGPQTLHQAGTGACVAEFKGQWTLHAGDTTPATGEQTQGWLDLRGAGVGLALGVREFVERCPQSLAVRGDRDGLTVEIGVWPAAPERTLRFAQGTRLSVEVAIVLHDGTLSAAERESRLAAVCDPLTAVPTPAYCCQTGVFGPVTDRHDRRFEAYSAGAAYALKGLRAEHMRYGVEDWGDTFDRCGYVRTESKLWTNLEWNYVATLVLEFVRSGDPAFWQAARLAARHFVDVDVAHVSSTPAWTGGAYVHTGDTREGHQVDPPDFAHAGWPEGLLWLYYLTGDARLRDTATGLADYVVRNLPPDGRYQAQPPFSMWNCDRQAGNPILTLACAYELTRDPAHRRALDRLVDFALRVQDPKLGCWSVPCYEEPSRHYPSPAWGAVLQRGLHRYWELTGDARVVRAFLRLGDFHFGRHPPETRHYLKPGSHYRTSPYFVTEACAFAALFATDPQPLLARGLEPLATLFPPDAPRAMDARGAPGALSAGCRLAGAAAAVSARPQPGDSRQGAGSPLERPRPPGPPRAAGD